jgi:cytochrome c5
VSLKEIVVTKFDASRWIASGVAAAALMAVSAVMAASMAHAASAPANGAAAPGKAIFEEQCGTCHELSVTTELRKSHDEWQATVARMITSGAALSDEQAAQVVDYLSKNYGTN